MADPHARKRLLISAAAILLLCLLLEGVIFQADALRTRELIPLPLDVTSARITLEEIAPEDNDVTAVMPSSQTRDPVFRTTLAFENLELENIRTLSFVLAGRTGLIRVEVSLADDAHRMWRTGADSVLALTDTPAYARIKSNGVLHELALSFETDDETAAVTTLTLNTPLPYHFSLLRLLTLLLPLWLIAAVISLRWWKIPLDRRNPRHTLAYCLTGLVCVLLVLCISALCIPQEKDMYQYTWDLKYPFEDELYEYRAQAHAVLYDMLANGRISVDVSPDENLLALENPYDPTQRLSSGAQTMFDYALYNGQYYVYFGLTPVLVFYAPFRLLTGAIPSYNTAGAFFALLTVLAAFLCFWEAVRRFIRRPSLLLTCICAAAVALGSHLLMLEASADRYHTSIACGQAFFFLTLWAAMTACRQKTRIRRTCLFILTALFSILLVGARATVALTAAGWLLPLFIWVLLNKKAPVRRRAMDALSFLIPLALGAAAIMLYNSARFGSVFEFGQTWQLTLEDIRYNRISFGDLGAALWAYFFDGVHLTSTFPYINPGSGFINRSGNWLYTVVNAGALTVPVTWGLFLIFALPEKARHGKLSVYLCTTVMTVFVALSGYCIAGVALRYVCDILPALCLVGAMVLTEAVSPDAIEGRGHTSGIAALLVCLTVIVALAFAFSNYRNYISLYAPAKYLQLFNLFTMT